MSKKKNSELNAATPAPTGKTEKAKKSAAKAPAAKKSNMEVPPAAPKAAAPKATSVAPASVPAKKTTKPVAAPAPSVAKSAPPVAKSAPPVAPKAKSQTAINGKSTPPASVPEISHDEVAKLAYTYAEARGFEGGSPESDWIRAEQEIRRLRGV